MSTTEYILRVNPVTLIAKKIKYVKKATNHWTTNRNCRISDCTLKPGSKTHSALQQLSSQFQKQSAGMPSHPGAHPD